MADDQSGTGAGVPGDPSALTVVVAFTANVFIAVAKTGAAVLTGSASLTAEAVHSWADTGNEAFLFIALKRSRRPATEQNPGGFGREAYVWSMFAAFGLFAAGAAVSIIHGVQELANPEPAQRFLVAYVVLAVAFVLDGVSLLQSVRQGRSEAVQADRDLLEHILATSDPTLRAVFAEDAAAVFGVMIASIGVALHQVTGSPMPDAVGSILVGVLLAVTSIVLIDRNRRFLLGEAVDPRIRVAALDQLLDAPEVRSVSYLHLEYSGPREVALIARVDLVEDAAESLVAAKLARLEDQIQRREGVSRAILALSRPGAEELGH